MANASAATGKLPPRLYNGSVKDVYGVAGKSPYVFAFSDRYSVFDWGEMPDALPEKGEALALIADMVFDYFRSLGIGHHSLGLVDENLKPVAEGQRSRYLAVAPVAVHRPLEERVGGKLKFIYEGYAKRPTNSLVPLEVIFRFGTPEGSSILKRIEREPELLEELGIAEMPRPGKWLAKPIVEFSTKLEPTDRPLRYAEAQAIAGLSDSEFAGLKARTLELAMALRNLFAEFGVELWDGKFEFAFGERKGADRDFVLVDSVGPDELRLLYKGQHLSKEILRRVYRGSEWYAALDQAKARAVELGTKDWKKICREELGQTPRVLTEREREVAAAIYPVLANSIAATLGRPQPFATKWELETLAEALGELA